MKLGEEIDKRMQGMKALMYEKKAARIEPAMSCEQDLYWTSGYWAGFAARQEWDERGDAEMLERVRKIPFGDVKGSVDG